jgi:hypothetical protein
MSFHRDAKLGLAGRYAIQGRRSLHAVEPAFLTIEVTDRRGRSARFTSFDGALAHAIFFREGTFDYFHNHVCHNHVRASATRGPVGRATRPGVLRVCALLPVAGTWRLFLRTKIAGRELVTPFSLRVR